LLTPDRLWDIDRRDFGGSIEVKNSRFNRPLDQAVSDQAFLLENNTDTATSAPLTSESELYSSKSTDVTSISSEEASILTSGDMEQSSQHEKTDFWAVSQSFEETIVAERTHVDTPIGTITPQRTPSPTISEVAGMPGANSAPLAVLVVVPLAMAFVVLVIVVLICNARKKDEESGDGGPRDTDKILSGEHVARIAEPEAADDLGRNWLNE
jgi:hypothetical protein